MIDCSDIDNIGASDEAKLLYPLYIENIENAKNKQWQIIYYFFLLQGAIIGLKGSDLKYNPCILNKMSLLITVFSAAIIGFLMVDIKLYRKRKNALKCFFTDEIRECVFQSFVTNSQLSSDDKDKYGLIILAHIILVLVQYVVWFI